MRKNCDGMIDFTSYSLPCLPRLPLNLPGNALILENYPWDEVRASQIHGLESVDID